MAKVTPIKPKPRTKKSKLNPEVFFDGRLFARAWLSVAVAARPTDRRNDTVWEIPRPSASRLHPTMKPVELITRAIECSSAPRDVIYDPFAGSGSTLIAAWGTDRVFAGSELDPVYCDVIAKRFQDHTGIVPIVEGVGERSFAGVNTE